MFDPEGCSRGDHEAVVLCQTYTCERLLTSQVHLSYDRRRLGGRSRHADSLIPAIDDDFSGHVACALLLLSALLQLQLLHALTDPNAVELGGGLCRYARSDTVLLQIARMLPTILSANAGAKPVPDATRSRNSALHYVSEIAQELPCLNTWLGMVSERHDESC